MASAVLTWGAVWCYSVWIQDGSTGELPKVRNLESRRGRSTKTSSEFKEAGNTNKRKGWTFRRCWNRIFWRELTSQLLPTQWLFGWKGMLAIEFIKKWLVQDFFPVVSSLVRWEDSSLSGQKDIDPLKLLQRAAVMIKLDHYIFKGVSHITLTHSRLSLSGSLEWVLPFESI